MFNFKHDLQTLQRWLLDDPRICDCLLVDETDQPNKSISAYLVATEPLNLEMLKARLAEQLPTASIPLEIIQVSNLPLNPDGAIDQTLLRQVARISEDLLDAWETQLRAQPEVAQAALLVQPLESATRLFHLADLLPDSGEEQRAENSGQRDRDAKGQEAGSRGQDMLQPAALALRDGGLLSIPAGAPRTLAEALIRTADAFPDKGMIYVQNDGSTIFQSYAELFETARSILAGLQAKGLKPKDRVVFQVATTRDHFAAFWACILGGIIPVNVAIAPSYTPGNSVVNKLWNVWKLLDRPLIITSAALMETIQGLATFLPMEGLKVLPVEELKRFAPTDAFHTVKPEDVLFHQLTSGSTGIPKCIQITHKGVVAHIHGSQRFNDYQTSDVTLNWLPLDHVVPILTCHLKDVYLGCQQVQVTTAHILAEPLRWLDYIDQYQVTHSWSPNFGFKLVADRLKAAAGEKGNSKRWNLSSTKYLMNAGEQVTPAVVREFLTLLEPYGLHPHAMQPAFGMAEACTCMTYRNGFEVNNPAHIQRFLKSSLQGRLRKSNQEDNATTAFVDLGPPIEGVQIRITDQANQVLPEGVIGRFQIKGDVITPGYLNNPAANQEAFVGDGWFNSGDLGFILNGCLTLTGREKEMIVIRGANYYCYEIEDVVNGVEGVESTFVAAYGVQDADTGSEGLVINFVPSPMPGLDQATVIKTIKQKITAAIGLTPRAVIPIEKTDFPKTTSGKIQRGQMRKSFLAGEYRQICKEVDLLLEQNTLPQWFFQRTWQRDNAQQWMGNAITGVLIFADTAGLGQQIAASLQAQGIACVLVEQGAVFAQLRPDHYTINPANLAEYQQLIQVLVQTEQRLSHILHLWSYAAPHRSQVQVTSEQSGWQLNLLNALFLVQALGDAQAASLAAESTPQGKLTLFFASNYAQALCDQELIVAEKTPLISLTHTIAQECPWLYTRHIDLEPFAEPVEAQQMAVCNAAHLIREMGISHSRAEVAYRQQQRWSAGLQAVDLPHAPVSNLTLKKQGTYIITGGLGGIGVELAKHLLEQQQARLLILGRSEISAQQAVYQKLATLKGQVSYQAVDVCDPAAVEEAINAFMGDSPAPLDGIFHLAGAYHDRYLKDETAATFQQILDPKVTGTLVLAQALQKRNPTGLFVTFSSIFGYFGASMVGAYAAANRFLEAFTRQLRQTSRLQSYCYAWSNWRDVGMSQGYQSLQSKGYSPISIRQGLLSLRAALARDLPFLIIGLDRSKGNIAAQLNQRPSASTQLVAYLTPADQGVLNLEALKAVEIQDTRGNRSQPRFVQRKALPLLSAADNIVDKERLHQELLATDKSYAPPVNQAEQLLVAIWKELLAKEPIGVRDNFFELGGSSLLMAQLQNKIQQTFHKQLSTVELFKYPTIRAMSEYFDQVENKQEATPGFRQQSAERAKARQELRRRVR